MKHPITMPGSKARMIERLWEFMPRPESGRVVVPFFGTGADSAFFHRQGLRVTCADAQRLLCGMHNDILACYAEAETALERAGWPEDARSFYKDLRDRHNRAPRPESFYLLSRLSFNRLIRHNKKGGFNAPIGDMRPSPLPPREAIEEWAEIVGQLEGPFHQDFRAFVARAEPGDLVYLDAPYLGTFDGYTGQPFPYEDLWIVLEDLSSAGISWACSQSLQAIPFISSGATIHEIPRSGCMNSDGAKRGKVKEILAVFDARE